MYSTRHLTKTICLCCTRVEEETLDTSFQGFKAKSMHYA
jgi:hypothetical protein